MGLTKWAGYLASSGLAVVSIDYRLSGVACYPTPFQDCLDAVDWIVESADELGVDTSRIGLWGDSAGGHLVLLLSTSQTRPGFAGPRMRTDAARIAAVVAWYPPTDLEALARMAAGSGRVEVSDFVGVAPGSDPERWREVSPYYQAHAKAPPSLVLQGTRDVLVPHRQATAYADKLRELGAPHELHIVEGGVHGFDRIDPGAEAKGLIKRSREFLRKHLI